MTKTLNKKNYLFIIAFTGTKIALVAGALALAIKPSLISNLYIKILFCLLLLGIGIALITMKRLHKADCFSIISHYSMRKTPCADSECLLDHKATKRAIFGSILQDLFGLTFAAASFILTYNVFFHKMPNEKLLFFTKIYCAIFAGSMLASAIIASVMNLIAYQYCKYKLTHGSDDEKNKFKESIKKNNNIFINFLNFFHSIANILLSIHFYACNLFVTRDHFTANFIAFDNGIRIKEEQRLLPGDEQTNAKAVIKKFETTFSCDCKTHSDKTNKYHSITNLGQFHVEVEADKPLQTKDIYKIEKNEYLDNKKVGIKFNMFGVEMMRLDFNSQTTAQ